MNTGFSIKAGNFPSIRFHYYSEAPQTVEAFHKILPFTITAFHARVSGEEIWTDKMPAIDVIQENASVFTQFGEAVLGPVNALRTKTAGCMGFYYGEGKGVDACNIFARVLDEDLPLLREPGEAIWKFGAKEINISAI